MRTFLLYSLLTCLGWTQAHSGKSNVQVNGAQGATGAIVSLALNPVSVPGGASSMATVTLSAIAPSAALITLSSNRARVVALPAKITVPQGLMTTKFMVTTFPVPSNTNVTITATFGTTSGRAIMTVTPARTGGSNAWSYNCGRAAGRNCGWNIPRGKDSIVITQAFDGPVVTSANSCCIPVGVGLAPNHKYEWIQDTITKADGTGSWHGLVPTGVQSAGDLFVNFPKGFGLNSEFYFQYKELMDPNIIACCTSGQYTYFPKGEGVKSNIMSDGEAPGGFTQSCQNNPGEMVTQAIGPDVASANHNNKVYPRIYSDCGLYVGPQLAVTDAGGHSDLLDQDATGCPHYGQVINGSRGIPDSQCWFYPTDGKTWFTLQVHVKQGAAWGQGTPSSINPAVFEMWAMKDGDPHSTLLISAADWTFEQFGDTSHSNLLWQKLWLNAYNTNNTGNTGPTTGVWFDDLIVSTRRIPDPNVSTPNAPDSVSLAINPGHSPSVMVTWRVNSNNDTAQDDTGFTIERCVGDQGYCFQRQNRAGGFTTLVTVPAHSSSYTDHAVKHRTTYTYRVKATNAAGDSAWASHACYNKVTNPCGSQITP